MTNWTPERIARLHLLWCGNTTAREIADELGNITRNAVIGMAYRLKLEKGSQPDSPANSVRQAVDRLRRKSHTVFSSDRIQRHVVDGIECTTQELLKMASNGTKIVPTLTVQKDGDLAPDPAPKPISHPPGLPPPEPDTVCTFDGCRGPPQTGRPLCAAHLPRPLRQREHMRLVERG